MFGRDAVSTNGRILVVDDESNARNALAEILREEGYVCETAADGFKGLGRFGEFEPDLVLTDLKMPGMDGVEFLTKVRERTPGLPVVVMTAFGAVDSAVHAMRSGAIDYLTKPINTDELLIVIERALLENQFHREAQDLRKRLDERYKFENVVGAAPAMQQIFKIAAQVAPSRATILLTGESGTGKELIAAAIHQRSNRAAGAFVKLHCAALAESILESELFGYEPDSPSGSQRQREGRLEQANGGTLFIDEIGDISPATQIRLLRVLQEHEFERTNSNAAIRANTRIIAATNRDLKAMVSDGKFREDLFYRLNVINLQLPPLRERASDVPALAMHFLRRYSEENAKKVERLSEAALTRLAAYTWPGNVRELENVIERAVVLSETGVIEAEHLPPEVVPGPNVGAPPIPGSTMGEIERYVILTTLAAQSGSTSRAADVLGISVRKIQYKLQEYGSAPKSGVPAIIGRNGEE
jgi:two-component system response regulator HydG